MVCYKMCALASDQGWLRHCQCCGCNEQISFTTSTKTTSPEGNKYWSCNLAAVWGQMATGGGFNKLEKSMSIV